MKKFTTLIVALAMVFTLASTWAVKADSGVRTNLTNKAATMAAVKWYRVGYDRDGNYLNPNTLKPADVTAAGSDGSEYQLFPWQKPNQVVWGRASTSSSYAMPRLLPTQGYDPLGRLIQGNRDYNNNYTTDVYAFWTEFFLTVTPSSGASQAYAHWYAVIDKEGNLWLDPDGVFHHPGLDITADPMYFMANNVRNYTEGSCLYNPKGTIDPLPNNNTQGPYKLVFTDPSTKQEVYFWWKYDDNGNLVDRVWKIGWADMCDYDPVPDPAQGWNPALPALSSVVGYRSAYDPYLKTTVAQNDIDWDYKLNTVDFAPSSLAWPNCSQGSECYFDTNGNARLDPYEPIYRKSTGNNANTVQVNDIRCVNMSVPKGIGNYVANYKQFTIVANSDYDFGRALIPLNSPTAPAGTPVYVHTNGQVPGNPNVRLENDEFVYRKSTSFVRIRTQLTAAMAVGTNTLTVASTAGFAVGDSIMIHGTGLDLSELATVASILSATQMTITSTVLNIHAAGLWVYRQVQVDLGDIRMSPINHRFNNSTDSLNWLGAWWGDGLVLLEVINGGCNTDMYNVTVETDLWEGMVPSDTAAALRTPNGDIVAAAQRIQKTTVLDPTGSEFRVPATTFENLKFDYREYLGVEIFKDNGINNNLGSGFIDPNVIRSSLSDDYSMWYTTEQFVGAKDEETAKDYAWSTATRPFFSDEMYIDLNGDGALGLGEPMYRDVDLSGNISKGDIRINDITIDNSFVVVSYAAGSRVTAGDVDVAQQTVFGWVLRSIPVSVRYYDQQHGCEPANRTYDIGEPIYFIPSMASNQTVLYSNNFNGVATPPWTNAWDPGNWTLIDENNSACGSSTSWADPNMIYWNPTETQWNLQVGSPTGSNAARFDRGMVINNASMVSGPTQTFAFDMIYEPRNWAGVGDLGGGTYGFNAIGVIFGYLNDRNFDVMWFAPSVDGTGNMWLYNGSGVGGGTYCPSTLRGLPQNYQGANIIYARFCRYVNGAEVYSNDVAAFNWTSWGTPFHVDVIMNSSTNVMFNLPSFFSQVDLSSLLVAPGAAMLGTGFGFARFAEDGTGYGIPDYWDDKDPAYIDNVQLLRPAAGLASSTVRLTDVWYGDVFYPAGSQVLSGDFYRVKNPIYGISTGSNCSKRYLDAEVLPGSVGLNVEVTPKLKVEQTSHIKITTNYQIEGEYVAGKVVGDKRTRLYYRPDSHILNTIPLQYQIVYSSKEDAEYNFYKPDQSVKGEVLYVSLRSTDFTESGSTLNSIRELYEKVGIIDAKNPILDWEFTPYRGTIIDDLGQDMPVLVKAYIEKGGALVAPPDSRFTNAINFNNSATRTVDPVAVAYYTNNYVDPWHMDRKWELKESYAQYYNQAYTRACRIVYSPYEVDKVSNCQLGDRYDCFGLEKLTVEPEGIKLVPNVPCVDPLSYRYPNITLNLSAYDNPNDVNDPAGYPMAVPHTLSTAKTSSAIGTYNVNGAGIRYMCMMKRWNRYASVNVETYYIVQVNEDGSYGYWTLSEGGSNGLYPQIRGVLDPNDTASPTNVPRFDSSNSIARGSNVYDVGDADCSVGSGVKDICGSGFPPLGDVNMFDTYGNFWDPDPAFNGTGEVYHYGVYSLITGRTNQQQGGQMSIVCQPINANSKLNIRVHTTNMVVDYNSTTDKNPGAYFVADNKSAVMQASQSNGTAQYNPSVSTNYKSNPPGIRYLQYAETIDYCDIVSLKVLTPDQDLNFNNFYVVDHALQFSNVGYSGSESDVFNGAARVRNDDPSRWIMPRYNPYCVYRPLSSDANTDMRSYPGGQTHVGRVIGNLRGNGYNSYPAMWRQKFNKLGTEFYGLTDYGVYFELSSGRGQGSMLSFATGTVQRIEFEGPFMTPLDIDPAPSTVKFRAGTAAGSTTGYQYKSLRFVPIKYDYTGKITVNPINYLAYELGASDYTNVISPACTIVGDRINRSDTNPFMYVGKELAYNRVSRPGGVRVFIFDEIIPIGPGRINITVWLTSGVKKVFQDCCVSPPANGVDVSGIKIDGMPDQLVVNTDSKLKLTLTEGYGIQSDGPPPEYGMGPQDFKECNDAYVYVWQDRGIMDPIDKLFAGAGDGYVTNPPQSTDYTKTYSGYDSADDLNGDGAISFDQYETEIMGKYEIATSTWDGGVIDARTFHRQGGVYMFSLDKEATPTTVGIDFGAKGPIVTPDHVIADDEMLDITVTAYKYGDDSNDRSFRPFWGGKTRNDQNTFSHEVYLAGQAAASVEAKEDFTATVTPNILTAGVQSELVDPTKPLTFTLKDANQQPVDLTTGVPDLKGDSLVKIDPMWMHLFKDPHPDDQYYYKGQVLPQYYWLRTDLHNNDYSAIGNAKLYSWTKNPFMPIKFSYNAKDGTYTFGGFVANDKGQFYVHIYSPDRKHKAVVPVNVELPIVSYETQTIDIGNNRSSTSFSVPGNAGDPDFVMTAVDMRRYDILVTVKTAEGQLIQGLAQSTSVCEGGGGMYARWTPFFTREKHYDWLAAPSTTYGTYTRMSGQASEVNYWLTGAVGGRSYQLFMFDLNNNGTPGEYGEYVTPGAQWSDSGIRLNGRTGAAYATYYPTVNRMYPDGTYARFQAWDGPFDKVSAAPEGYGCGCIYNNEYEKLYIFGDLSKDFRLTYRDSLNINNRGQGIFRYYADDECKVGALIGVSEWGLLPEFADVYGGAQPYTDPYMPQRTITRFVHSMSGSSMIGTNDGAYYLDWDAMPNKLMEAKYPKITVRWAESNQEVSKQYLDKDNYDLAYGIENHLVLEVFPADSRDLPVIPGAAISIGYNSTYEHPWRGPTHESAIFGYILSSPINPRSRIAQVYFTPTGTGKNLASVDLWSGQIFEFPLDHAFEVINFDIIMSLQIVADTPENLKVGKAGKLVVTVVETANNPNMPNTVAGATVHIKGAGVEAEKKTDKDGKAEFMITPTERGRIVITASYESMKDTYDVVYVESYVAPPMLDVSPVSPVIASNSITIDGRTNEGCRVTVNGKPATVDEKGQFKATVKLNPGMNNVVVVATNALGQSVTKIVRIESKTTPSGIIIDKLGDFENVKQIRIRGHVEPGTKVEVTNSTNGASGIVSVVNDTFVCDIDVAPGANTFEVKATDKVGQVSTAKTDAYIWTTKTVKIQLGSKVAVVDGIPVSMATAPVVTGGNGFVPLADIVSMLIPGTAQPVTAGNTVTVTFGTHTLTLTLKQTTAMLDTAPMSLKAAPYVANGIVMFPITNLNLFTGNETNVTVEVLNDAASKTITITRRW